MRKRRRGGSTKNSMRCSPGIPWRRLLHSRKRDKTMGLRVQGTQSTTVDATLFADSEAAKKIYAEMARGKQPVSVQTIEQALAAEHSDPQRAETLRNMLEAARRGKPVDSVTGPVNMQITKALGGPEIEAKVLKFRKKLDEMVIGQDAAKI